MTKYTITEQERGMYMWIAKILRVIIKDDGTQEQEIVCFIECESLKDIYNKAMRECKDQRCALAAIYKDMNTEDVLRDDPTKGQTKAMYQILKGTFGGILLHGRNHDKRLLHVRENKKENRHEKIDQKTMDTIASYMDDDIRETVHFELAPCTPKEFLCRYLDLDPDFTQLLESEFSIDADELTA